MAGDAFPSAADCVDSHGKRPACQLHRNICEGHAITFVWWDVQAMLDQYSGRDRGIHKLDSALKEAVQMVRVSDERISYLRKMHALLLLKR